MTTTEQRNRQVVKIADAAMMVDIDTGEVLAERTKSHPVSQPAPKKSEKLPYGAFLLPGVTCPECGAPVAQARMAGKQFHVCTKQFSEEPECWYASELPKEGTENVGEGTDAAEDGASGESFSDGGADLGGAQFKTASKTEGEDGGAKTGGKGKTKKR